MVVNLFGKEHNTIAQYFVLIKPIGQLKCVAQGPAPFILLPHSQANGPIKLQTSRLDLRMF